MGVASLRAAAVVLGFLSVLSFLVGAIVAAIAYRGKTGERFAFRNHYVSELGEIGVSRLAAVFNASLVVGGLAPLPAFVLFAFGSDGSWVAIPGVSTGVAAGALLAMVGFFPVNAYAVHIVSARLFFTLFFPTQAFVTAAIVGHGGAGSPAGALVIAASACCVAAYLSCLFGVPLLTGTTVGYFHTRISGTRPRIVPLAIGEWAVFFSATFWIAAFSTSLVLLA